MGLEQLQGHLCLLCGEDCCPHFCKLSEEVPKNRFIRSGIVSFCQRKKLIPSDLGSQQRVPDFLFPKHSPKCCTVPPPPVFIVNIFIFRQAGSVAA